MSGKGRWFKDMFVSNSSEFGQYLAKFPNTAGTRDRMYKELNDDFNKRWPDWAALEQRIKETNRRLIEEGCKCVSSPTSSED